MNSKIIIIDDVRDNSMDSSVKIREIREIGNWKMHIFIHGRQWNKIFTKEDPLICPIDCEYRKLYPIPDDNSISYKENLALIEDITKNEKID